MPDERHSLCVSLHGVAPATLDDCRDTLAFLDAMRVSPVALLAGSPMGSWPRRGS